MKRSNKTKLVLAAFLAVLFLSPVWVSAGGRWTRDDFPDGRSERRYPRFIDRDGDGVGARIDCNDYDGNVWQRVSGGSDLDYDGYVGEQFSRTACVGSALQRNGRTYYWVGMGPANHRYDYWWLPDSQILGYGDRYVADPDLH